MFEVAKRGRKHAQNKRATLSGAQRLEKQTSRSGSSRRHSKATLSPRDCARDLSGDVGLRAAETLRVWGGDVHGDVYRRMRPAHRNSESSVVPARKRQNRFGPGLTRNPKSAWLPAGSTQVLRSRRLLQTV